MKKLLALIIFVGSGFLTTSAQSIPNGDMEDWIAVTGYDSLAGFTSTNLFFFPSVNVTKVTDVHGGSFAARMTGTTWLGIFNVPGGIGTNAEVNLTTFALSGGYPYTERPNAFTGWFKYEPSNNDSCILLAVLTKWNGTKRYTIGIAPYFGKSTANAYKEFTSNVIYFSTENPDTAFVMALTSSAFLTAQVASVLYVDDLAFTFNVGVPTVSDNEIVINTYPNPARDFLNIELKGNHNVTSVTIFDVLGNKLSVVEVSSGNIVLTTATLPDGMYVYQLNDKKKVVVATGKFSVKH